jgi:threonine dehydrogenase-like Zn-dependent dehydrogenase
MCARRLVALRPRHLELEEFELADQPPPGTVLAETTCTLISTGTELANWTGLTAYRRAMGEDWSAQPYRPGYSYVGVVRAAGDGVAGVAVGDRICGQGGHASAAVLDAAKIAAVPAGVSDVQASFATLLVITMNAVRRAGIELGERVAAVGLGLIGNLALQQARLCGAMPVAGSDLLAARRAYAERVGLLALDPCAAGFAERVAHLTDGERFDVVFEATGSPAALTPALKLAAHNGRVVALGSTRGLVEQLDLYGDVHVPGITLIGAHVSTAPRLPNAANRWTEEASALPTCSACWRTGGRRLWAWCWTGVRAVSARESPAPSACAHHRLWCARVGQVPVSSDRRLRICHITRLTRASTAAM